MGGLTNFPTGLDDDSSLYDVTDTVSTPMAAHHNNIKEAVKAIEAKLGIRSSAVPTSLDYRIGNPTGAHTHDGASGNGPRVIGSANYIVNTQQVGSLGPSGLNKAFPLVIGKTMRLDSVQGALRVGPSGASAAWVDINFGPTSLWQASQGDRMTFAVMATVWRQATPALLITYPSGAVITIDVDAIGGPNSSGQDLSVTFVFRD